VPLRRIVPSIGRLDTATFIIAFGIQYLTILIIATLRNWPVVPRVCRRLRRGHHTRKEIRIVTKR